MRLFERVVIALEPGPRAQALLSVAGRLASQFRSRLTLVHTQLYDVYSQHVDEMNREVRRKFDFWAKQLCQTGARSVEPVLVSAPPALGIEEVAASQRATLLVVAERMDTGQNRSWFGTTTQRLARRLNTPLMVIRPDSDPELQPILALVDFSDASRLALQQAIEMTRRFDSRLTILHVSPKPLQAPHFESSLWGKAGSLDPAWSSDVASAGSAGSSWNSDTITLDRDFELDHRLNSARVELDNFLMGFDLSDIAVERIVLAGSPVPETLTLARRRRIGLIVTGAGQPQAHRIGLSNQTPAEALAELSEIPVMIFHHQPLRMMLSKDQTISRSHYI